jgi:aspartate/glutamate racemase
MLNVPTCNTPRTTANSFGQFWFLAVLAIALLEVVTRQQNILLCTVGTLAHGVASLHVGIYFAPVIPHSENKEKLMQVIVQKIHADIHVYVTSFV